ncbi:MAG: hypothetical protein CM1200mP30_11240 [Pseudomonadota bacterium]|nr:MAG: hypothetical protein CM1200mP30_11240 [Pseudomonadota bacterium]
MKYSEVLELCLGKFDFPESFDISNEMANIITAVEGISRHKMVKDDLKIMEKQTRKRCFQDQ